MEMRTPTLVLFDIDGTLITTAGAGVRAMSAAFEQIYGVADALAGVAVAGARQPSSARRGTRVLLSAC
ncbi:MAG: hypothetical protein ABI051_09735 [Vicinamibacterales bacterium]